jgi:SOS-response transcriptional repressor LexA
MLHTIQETLVNCQQVNLFDATSKTCNNRAMTLGDRIKEAREAAGYEQDELAVLLNISQQSISQWETGETKRPKKLNELAGILGVSVEYLLNGQEDIIDIPYSVIARCPLISWVDAKSWPKNRTNLKIEKKISHPGNKVVLNGNCYLLQIEDNSMVNYMEATGFNKGKYIIVDPNKKYKNESYVVAKKINWPKLLFRQYINDGESEYLNPLNIGHYSRIELTPDIEICGVVAACLDILI